MSQYRGLWEELRIECERRIREYEESLPKYVQGASDDNDDWGYDDSEAFRWEYEYKCRLEARGHTYIPSNWSDCYEREIMGRSNDSYSGLYEGDK